MFWSLLNIPVLLAMANSDCKEFGKLDFVKYAKTYCCIIVGTVLISMCMAMALHFGTIRISIVVST